MSVTEDNIKRQDDRDTFLGNISSISVAVDRFIDVLYIRIAWNVSNRSSYRNMRNGMQASHAHLKPA